MLILASQSPRRREILTMLGYNFLCKPADADETIPQSTPPEAAVQLLARRKAEAVSCNPEDVVLGSDTVVALENRILGKPRDEREAAEMLRALSGKCHTVHTGVCLKNAEKCTVFAVPTLVEFFPLTEEEIAAYIATGDPMDKAGAYGIQGIGAVNVRRIDGDFFTVMGLPAAQTARALRDFEIYPTSPAASKR